MQTTGSLQGHSLEEMRQTDEETQEGEEEAVVEDGAEMEDASSARTAQGQQPPEPGRQRGCIVPQNLQGNQSCQQLLSHFSPPEP